MPRTGRGRRGKKKNKSLHINKLAQLCQGFFKEGEWDDTMMLPPAVQVALLGLLQVAIWAGEAITDLLCGWTFTRGTRRERQLARCAKPNCNYDFTSLKPCTGTHNFTSYFY